MLTMHPISKVCKVPRLGILATSISLITICSFLMNEYLLRTYYLSNRVLKEDQKIAIATLVANTDGDLFDFCLALKSLNNLPSSKEVAFLNAPVMVFHEGDFNQEQISIIMGCTDRTISFPKVEFGFPEGFDPAKEHKSHARVSVAGVKLGRNMWGYTQMCRFWNTQMWEHPATQHFETIMRIDTDSCFHSVDSADVMQTNKILPELDTQFVYQSIHNFGSMSGGSKFIEGLFEFAMDYIKKNNITPSHPELWDKLKSVWEINEELILFRTNIEVTRRSFFQRHDVRKWHEALSEIEPFGMLRYRWGDAQTRALTIALFATKETVLLDNIPGYVHGRGFCQEYYNVEGDRKLDNAFSFVEAR